MADILPTGMGAADTGLCLVWVAVGIVAAFAAWTIVSPALAKVGV